MVKQTIKLLLVFTLCAGLLVNFTGSTNAQSIPSQKIRISEQNIANQAEDPNTVTWEMLGLSEANLVGPYDSLYFSFFIPADWKLSEGATLNLSLGVSVTTAIQNVPDNQNQLSNGVVGSGTITVVVNNNIVSVLPVDQLGETVRNITIPVAAFASQNNDGFVEVTINLASGTSCYNFDQMNVVIRTSSFLTLPHESIQPSTNLVNFPRPIYQSSFSPDSVLLVIPDQPSALELQAALTVASGLGKLSNGNLTPDMVTLGKLTADQQEAGHLIFVGKSSSLPVLSQFQLPEPVSQGQFQVSGANLDDGFVEMINSPWDNTNVVLVVSGNTDQGTVKAAQAISNGIFQPSEFPNLAVVQEVQTVPITTPQPTDQTLTSLGYKGRLFESRGVSNVTYNFDVPPGWAVASDSSFELVFGHSALLDYATSGIVVFLNGKPIGSVRLSDASASISANKSLINIPASAIIPGKNRLDVRVNLAHQNLCSPENMRGLWINIWPESTLHLPLDLALVDTVSSLNLASYPAPFTYYPLLDNTAFVLMHDNLESWRSAVAIASFLGSTARGPVTALNVYYGDNLPEEERSKYNLLVIGHPTQLPVMGEINRELPIPFLDGSDVPTEGNFQITYRISSDSPMGYMELFSSPWNPDNVVLAILGNTPQGLGWATSALIDPDLRLKLAGNFAVINDQQIITTDTRLSSAIQAQPTQMAEVVVIPPSNGDPSSSLSPEVQQSTAWVFPVFVASVILIILISAFVAIGTWSRHRTRGNAQRGEYQDASQGFLGAIKQWFGALFVKGKKPRKDS